MDIFVIRHVRLGVDGTLMLRLFWCETHLRHQAVPALVLPQICEVISTRPYSGSRCQLTIGSPGKHNHKLQAVHGGADDDGRNVSRRVFGLEDLRADAIAGTVGDEEHCTSRRLFCAAGNVGRDQCPNHFEGISIHVRQCHAHLKSRGLLTWSGDIANHGDEVAAPACPQQTLPRKQS